MYLLQIIVKRKITKAEKPKTKQTNKKNKVYKNRKIIDHQGIEEN